MPNDEDVLGTTTEDTATSEAVTAESTAAEEPAEATTPAETVPEQKWQGSFDDVSETQRRITVTEKDGRTVTAPFNWPGKRVAENLEGLQFEIERGVNGRQVSRMTQGDYHAALMEYFGQAMIDSKPAGKVNDEFFENVSNKTYQYFMDQADSFLDKVSNAD
ncbi:hypothetical protein [Lactiplantibacillus paraxiangfangensis]|uniref:hypothetical protein n=1 Tax=Lactiplantibacillus paraxiangfangensis TaxID=3076224 RepID=UPI0030C6E6F6